MTDNKEIQIFQSADGDITLDVSLTQETVWLSQVQMSELFGTKRPAITKHLSNIYNSDELEELTTCSILEHMADHGQRYKTAGYQNVNRHQHVRIPLIPPGFQPYRRSDFDSGG